MNMMISSSVGGVLGTAIIDLIDDPDITTTTSTTPSMREKRQATSPRRLSDFHYDFSDEDEPIELHDYGDVIDRDQLSMKPYGFRQSLLPNSREGQI